MNPVATEPSPLPFDFARGWAVSPFMDTRSAHYFVDAGAEARPLRHSRGRGQGSVMVWRRYQSLCHQVDTEVTPAVPLQAPKGWPRCVNCVRVMKARTR